MLILLILYHIHYVLLDSFLRALQNLLHLLLLLLVASEPCIPNSCVVSALVAASLVSSLSQARARVRILLVELLNLLVVL